MKTKTCYPFGSDKKKEKRERGVLLKKKGKFVVSGVDKND